MSLVSKFKALFNKPAPEPEVDKDMAVSITLMPFLGPMVWKDGITPSEDVQRRALQAINVALRQKPIQISYREKNEAVTIIYPESTLYTFDKLEDVDPVQPETT